MASSFSSSSSSSKANMNAHDHPLICFMTHWVLQGYLKPIKTCKKNSMYCAVFICSELRHWNSGLQRVSVRRWGHWEVMSWPEWDSCLCRGDSWKASLLSCEDRVRRFFQETGNSSHRHQSVSTLFVHFSPSRAVRNKLLFFFISYTRFRVFCESSLKH